MTDEDFAQLQAVGRHLRDLRRVGLLSPAPRRRRRPLWRPHPRSEFKVFPNATALSRRRWNLDARGTDEFELIVASSVLMYSGEPARWLSNIFAVCEYFLMIDLVCRRRRADSELDDDGDSMRFAIGDARPRIELFFHLSALGDRLLAFRTCDGGANAHDDQPLHLIALFRGDLAVPGEERRKSGIAAAVGELAHEVSSV